MGVIGGVYFFPVGDALLGGNVEGVIFGPL